MKQDIQKYDFEEPREGHELRFVNKLDFVTPKKAKYVYLWKVAVVALLFFSGVTMAYFLNQIWKGDETYKLCVNEELQEVNFYYASQENKRIERLRDLDIDSVLLEAEILNVENIMDTLCIHTQNNVDEELVISVLVNYYQKRINTLDYIINQLEAVKNRKKKNSYESINF